MKAVLAEEFRDTVRDTLAEAGTAWEYSPILTMERGPYTITSVMDETASERWCQAFAISAEERQARPTEVVH